MFDVGGDISLLSFFVREFMAETETCLILIGTRLKRDMLSCLKTRFGSVAMTTLFQDVRPTLPLHIAGVQEEVDPGTASPLVFPRTKHGKLQATSRWSMNRW